jgi:hypothetical protein
MAPHTIAGSHPRRDVPPRRDRPRPTWRSIFTLSGDLHITGDTLHVRLDAATAPRRSRALHALCQQLTETGTRYPDTNLTISCSVKGQPDTP